MNDKVSLVCRVRQRPGRVLAVCLKLNQDKFNNVFEIQSFRAGSLCPKIRVAFKGQDVFVMQFFAKRIEFSGFNEFWHSYFVTEFQNELSRVFDAVRKENSLYSGGYIRNMRDLVKQHRDSVQGWIDRSFSVKWPNTTFDPIDCVPEELQNL